MAYGVRPLRAGIRRKNIANAIDSENGVRYISSIGRPFGSPGNEMPSGAGPMPTTQEPRESYRRHTYRGGLEMGESSISYNLGASGRHIIRISDGVPGYEETHRYATVGEARAKWRATVDGWVAGGMALDRTCDGYGARDVKVAPRPMAS